MAKQKGKQDVRDTIMEWLNLNERGLGWLASKTNFKYSTLYSIFRLKKANLSELRLEKINAILGTAFEK